MTASNTNTWACSIPPRLQYLNVGKGSHQIPQGRGRSTAVKAITIILNWILRGGLLHNIIEPAQPGYFDKLPGMGQLALMPNRQVRPRLAEQHVRHVRLQPTGRRSYRPYLH